MEVEEGWDVRSTEITPCCWLCHGGVGCESREAGGFLEAGRSRETELPWSPQDRNSALLTLILAKRDLFWTCNV